MKRKFGYKTIACCLSAVLLLSGCQSKEKTQSSTASKSSEKTSSNVDADDLAKLITILDNGDFAINGKDTGVKAQGEKGEDGKDGTNGTDGLQGIIGRIGQKGNTGAKGDQGDTGTQGAKGETGDKGEQGEQGTKGEKGDSAVEKPVALDSWNDALLTALSSFEDGGGYLTNLTLKDSLKEQGFTQTTWQGMDEAFEMGENDLYPNIDVSKARPSFCSSATYMALLKTISIWDSKQETRCVSQAAWKNLKPITIGTEEDPRQDDGYGCWGRANANANGFSILINELGAGKNFYVGTRQEYTSDQDYYAAWDQGQRLDFMKIFWNENIGCGDNDESGHMVIYLGSEPNTDSDGNRDDTIYFWSSNGSHADINAGYGVKTTSMSKIKRAVFTRITDPENFDNAKTIVPYNKQDFLDAMNGKRNGTVEEMKEYAGIN
jgi:hypothetical protein